jgi:hypothetical protein
VLEGWLFEGWMSRFVESDFFRGELKNNFGASPKRTSIKIRHASFFELQHRTNPDMTYTEGLFGPSDIHN